MSIYKYFSKNETLFWQKKCTESEAGKGSRKKERRKIEMNPKEINRVLSASLAQTLLLTEPQNTSQLSPLQNMDKFSYNYKDSYVISKKKLRSK